MYAGTGKYAGPYKYMGRRTVEDAGPYKYMERRTVEDAGPYKYMERRTVEDAGPYISGGRCHCKKTKATDAKSVAFCVTRRNGMWFQNGKFDRLW